jgi:hypothetical protein
VLEGVLVAAHSESTCVLRLAISDQVTRWSVSTVAHQNVRVTAAVHLLITTRESVAEWRPRHHDRESVAEWRPRPPKGGQGWIMRSSSGPSCSNCTMSSSPNGLQQKCVLNVPSERISHDHVVLLLQQKYGIEEQNSSRSGVKFICAPSSGLYGLTCLRNARGGHTQPAMT